MGNMRQPVNICNKGGIYIYEVIKKDLSYIWLPDLVKKATRHTVKCEFQINRKYFFGVFHALLGT